MWSARKILPIIYLVVSCASSFKIIQLRPGLIAIRLFWGNGTVDKFPPIIEYFVQRIQSMNSNYVYEDLSRPPTWEKPVYTLSPSDQHLTAVNPGPESTTQAIIKPVFEDESVITTKKTPILFEYEEMEETTGNLFEIITTAKNTDKV